MRAALVAKLQTAARSDLSADDWAALSKSDVVDRWLTRTIKGFDVSELANKEIAKLRAFKQGSMTTEIYFQELQSVMTATRLIYHIAYEEVPNEVATEADRCRLALMGLAMTRVLPGRKKRGRVLPVILPVFRPIVRFSR